MLLPLPRSASSLLLALAISLTLAPATQAGGSPSLDAREQKVIARINALRADHHLAPLVIDARLSRAADRHSQRMQRRRTLSHQLPGEAPLPARLRWAVGSARVGEVVFWGGGGAGSRTMVRAWMRSSSHRATLLTGRFVRAGIGIRSGGGGAWATIDVAAK